MKILIAGCGWLGRALGRSLVSDGHAVVGVRRDTVACEALGSVGIEPLQCDLAAPNAARALPSDIDAVVACQAAGQGSADGYQRAYIQAMTPLLELAGRGGLKRLVFTSSTGVFGNTDGAEVDEDSPPRPASPTARVMLEAERRVLGASASGSPACIVRLSGLYGPERYGVIDRVRQGRLALGPSDSAWMNWCHRQDAVRTVRALIDRGQAGRIYHASDGEPTRRRDVVRWICGRLGIQPPAAAGAAKSGPPVSRRVSAVASRRALDLSLAFPSYRDGLEDALSPPGRRNLPPKKR